MLRAIACACSRLCFLGLRGSGFRQDTVATWHAQIGQRDRPPCLITNGRELAEGFPNNVDSVVILLNADKASRTADGELDAYWGAYVGTPEEILVAGKLKDIVDQIERIKSAAREEHGWIMYALMLK